MEVERERHQGSWVVGTDLRGKRTSSGTSERQSSFSEAAVCRQGWGTFCTVRVALEPGEEGLVLTGEGLGHREGPHCLSLQWDLVCEQRGLNKITSTCFFVGVLVGAVVYGYLSDR